MLDQRSDSSDEQDRAAPKRCATYSLDAFLRGGGRAAKAVWPCSFVFKTRTTMVLSTGHGGNSSAPTSDVRKSPAQVLVPPAVHCLNSQAREAGAEFDLPAPVTTSGFAQSSPSVS
jgi:hypothetical protein